MIYAMIPKEQVWYRQIWRTIRRELRWLIPGIGVKRWIGLILLGTTLLGVGIAMGILEIYRTAPDTWWLAGSFAGIPAFPGKVGQARRPRSCGAPQPGRRHHQPDSDYS